MTGEVERLKSEEAQAALEKKRAAEALMEEVHRSNAEQVCLHVSCLRGISHDTYTTNPLQYAVEGNACLCLHVAAS